jgi:hypothetical protein
VLLLGCSLGPDAYRRAMIPAPVIPSAKDIATALAPLIQPAVSQSSGSAPAAGFSPLLASAAPPTEPATPPTKIRSESELAPLRGLLIRIRDLIEASDKQMEEIRKDAFDASSRVATDSAPRWKGIKEKVDKIRSDFVAMATDGSYQLYESDVGQIGIGDAGPFTRLSNVLAAADRDVHLLATFGPDQDSFDKMGDGMRSNKLLDSRRLTGAMTNQTQVEFNHLQEWLEYRRRKWQEVKKSIS